VAGLKDAAAKDAATRKQLEKEKTEALVS